MPDAADVADTIVAEHLARGLARVAPVPAGEPGECDECGELMPRLVNGRCGFCRDGRVPPPDWEPPAIPTPINRGAETMATEQKRTITFAARGDVLAAIEARAEENNIGIGPAALELIEMALLPPPQPRAAEPAPMTWRDHLVAATQMIGELEDQADAAPDLSDELAAMTARAEEAEAKLAAMKGLLA